MALLTTKPTYPAAGMGQPASRYAYNVSQPRENHGFFASPTESEFSEHFDAHASTRNWDEERVAEWLRSINCSQYVELFMVNNINGANLMELDRSHLRDMGIKKVGDQIRIASQAKKFRNKEYNRISKRNSNRVSVAIPPAWENPVEVTRSDISQESLALLDNASFTPPSSASPKPASRSAQMSRADKRMSRQISDLNQATTLAYSTGKTGSRPSSPYIDDRTTRARYGGMSPPQRDANGQPTSASSFTSRGASASANPAASRYGLPPRTSSQQSDTPQTARFGHMRSSPSTDSSVTTAAILPLDKPLIRVIYDGGRASVVNIEGWKSPEDVMLKALRKGSLNESYVKNYRFYVLDGTEPNPALCRPINDDEVRRICQDTARLERGRLILRKIHQGEPDEEQLKTAAGIATQQKLQQTQNVIIPSSARSQLKVEKVMGESLAPVSYPLSPASAKERERQAYLQQTVQRANTAPSSAGTRTRRMKELFGGRPPSELIASDLSTYFPDFEKDEIDRTVRNSIRRSRRLSRAASRLSTMSNVSLASSLKDAPPLPTISDAWLNGQNQPSRLRPLSVLRIGGGTPSAYRDSITSSVLEPLDEESPLEPDRKSYVSFSGVSDAVSSVAVTDPDGHTTMKSYYDDAGSSVANSSLSGDGEDSLNKRLSQLVHEDSEESDEELTEYLENPSWDNIRYMKGALIGKGSFGSVYLALHAVTGELMAVKQVEIPAEDSGDTVASEKKKNMLAALKHEIGLLRELKHPNIVQYLGSNSDDTHLNIFLEYVPGGSVATMLVNYGPLGESLISNFVRQILTGLAYLHSKDIIHRDIKGANILVDNKGSVKISDFGISKRVEASSLLHSGPTSGAKGLQRVSLQGSVFWMAPEVVRQTTYTRKADIWSVGCLVVEMFTGAHPHPNCTQLQAIFKIGGSNDASPSIPDNASVELREFCRRCFVVDHEKRPSAEDLLKSGFCRPDFK